MNDPKIPRQLMTTFDQIDLDAMLLRLENVKNRIESSKFELSQISTTEMAIFTHSDTTQISFRQEGPSICMHAYSNGRMRWMKVTEKCDLPITSHEECLAIIDQWISHIGLPLHFMEYNNPEEYPQTLAARKAARIFQTCTPTIGGFVHMECPNPYNWDDTKRISMGPDRFVYLNNDLADEIFSEIPSTIQLTEMASIGYRFTAPDRIQIDAAEINDPIERMQVLGSVAHITNPIVTKSGNRVRRSIG